MKNNQSRSKRMVNSFKQGAVDQADYEGSYVIAAIAGVLYSKGNLTIGIAQGTMALGRIILLGGAQRVVVNELNIKVEEKIVED